MGSPPSHDQLWIALAGTDSDVGEQNIDSLQLARVDYENATITLFAIPRDLYVETEKYQGRLNGLAKWRDAAGATDDDFGALRSELGRLVGADIPYFIIIAADDFPNLVDALGGLSIDNSCPFTTQMRTAGSWRTYSFPTGPTNLTGESALAFARYRGDAGDLQRIARQQQIMAALKMRVLTISFGSRLAFLVTLNAHIRSNLTFIDKLRLILLGMRADALNIRAFRFKNSDVLDRLVKATGQRVITLRPGVLEKVLHDPQSPSILQQGPIECQSKYFESGPDILPEDRPVDISKEVLDKSLKGSPSPLDPSPDGKLLLLKERRFDSSGLQVANLETGEILATRYDRNHQRSAVWSPNGDSIAYLINEDDQDNFYPWIWNWRSGQTVKLTGAPVTTISLSKLRWSPDGKWLVYYVGSPQSGELVITPSPDSLALGAVTTKYLGRTIPGGDYRWLSDSSAVAWIARENARALMISSISGTHHRIPLPDNSDFQELAVHPDNRRFLLSAREPDQEFFKIIRIKCPDGKMSACELSDARRENADLMSPRWIGDTDEAYVYVRNQSSPASIKIETIRSPEGISLSKRSGDTMLVGDVRGRTLYLGQFSRQTPQDLYRIDLDTNQEQHIYPFAPHAPAPLNPTFVTLHSTNNVEVPAIFWDAGSKARPARGAVIMIHGGPAIQTRASWNILNEQLVENGISVMAVNYRGSSRYGRRFERDPGIDAQTNDLLAARQDLADRGFSPNQIGIYAESFGVVLAVRAHQRWPDLFNRFVLVSPSIQLANLPPAIQPGPASVFAFHGYLDPLFKSADALRELRRVLDPDLGTSAQHTWTVFRRDGHALQQATSGAVVRSRLLDLFLSH